MDGFLPFAFPLAVLIVLVVLIGLFIRRLILIIPQANAIVVERLGKFNRVSYSGVRFVLPFVEAMRSIYYRAQEVDVDGTRRIITKLTTFIDLREQVVDFPKQNVITRDNVTMEIDAIMYFQVDEPAKAVYGISNLLQGIEKLVQTSLRNLVGQLTLDETFSSRETINTHLKIILDEATAAWGIRVTRVELQEITPPAEIRQVMEMQMTAEREKRAVILRAEGNKQSAVLEAEGEALAKVRRAESTRQAHILEAEGQAQARLTVAKAEADSLYYIEEKIGREKSASYLISLKYLESLGTISNGQSTKMFIPYEATGILSALGGIRDILGGVEPKTD
jgi:regulator of protease activity HflC (stomatin/prohibitin superfamily)